MYMRACTIKPNSKWEPNDGAQNNLNIKLAVISMISLGYSLPCLRALNEMVPIRIRGVFACSMVAHPTPRNLDVEMATLQVHLHDVS